MAENLTSNNTLLSRLIYCIIFISSGRICPLTFNGLLRNTNYIGREMQQVLELFVVTDSIGKRVDAI